MQSLWSSTTEFPKREMLSSDAQVQNVVIGAGMAGILIAYFLKQEGREVIILEADQIAGGQTQNTTAKITSQHGLIYHDMVKKAGRERARGYAMANEKAIKTYEEIIRKEGISCHFERVPSFLYSTTKEGVTELLKEEKAAQELGINAYFVEGEEIQELPFPVMGAVCFENQAQFHPLEFIRHLSADIRIYENTKVLKVKKNQVITDRGTVTAQNIIFATHYPFPIVPGFYFLRQHQTRSYVVALEGKSLPEKLSAMYYSIDAEGLSFRWGENCLILGGGTHRTGKSGINKQAEGYCFLRHMVKRYYPKAKEVACWAAQDCMPHDRIPFVGKFSVFKPDWYVATGFQKWGMTTSMIAAMIISDMIVGRANSYQGVFAPQRILFRAGIKNLCIDIGESVVGLTKGLFVKKEKRCRHMGCALSWNDEEGTWDCSCHGSRFDKEGRLIDNPAQANLQK